MDKAEAIALLKQLKPFFDTIRYVDINTHTYYTLNPAGTAIVPLQEKCYDVWGRGNVCANCISARTVSQKARSNKFECINQTIYSIVSNYVEIEGQPYSMELVFHIDSNTLFTGLSQDSVIKSIDDFNNKLYHDPLTLAFNRLYLNEHYPENLHNMALAMIDVDHLKAFNDTYGHKAGDLAITSIAQTIQSCIRSSDALVRVGGDEFVLVFNKIPYAAFVGKLEHISQLVKHTEIPNHPELKLSVSIGGAYGSGSKAELMERADKMLYQAKTQRGSVIIETEAGTRPRNFCPRCSN